MANSTDITYGAEHIKTLSGYEHVRKRPGMYIGVLDNPNHLAVEIIANSLDEAMNGYGDEIIITLHKNGKELSVRDYGRGIIVDGKREEDNLSTLEAAFSVLNTGGKYDQAAFSNSLGTNGIGSKAATFLSTELQVDSIRNGKMERINFAGGETVAKKILNTKEKDGVEVFFKPDGAIFDSTTFNIKDLGKLLQDMAYLTRGVTFKFINEVDNKTTKYYSENGLKDYLDDIVKDNGMLKRPLYINSTDGDKMFLEVALTYEYGKGNFIKTYANNGHTPEDGAHLTAFKRVLTRQFNLFANAQNMYNDGESNLSGKDYEDGMVLILNIKAPDILYSSQTKTKVNSSDLGTFISAASTDAIEMWLNSNQKDARKVVQTALDARRAGEAAQKAKDKVRKAPAGAVRSGLKAKAEISDKLIPANSKSKVKERELFILEGDSAQSSAIDARAPKTQALYAVRGKSLNAERASVERTLENKEYIDLINIVGSGFGEEFEVRRSQYGKIIILTDADDDGFHIQTLLLTFLFNYMQDAIKEGMVYIAVPPLYIASKGDKKVYLTSEEDLKEFEKTNKGYFIDRFKGLGSMHADDLARTTMDPKTRNIVQVSIDNFKGASEIISDLMGDDVEVRRQYIFEHASEILV